MVIDGSTEHDECNVLRLMHLAQARIIHEIYGVLNAFH
jgi:hypothetical protein